MREIVFVTHNKGKVASAQKYFKNINLKTYDHDLEEPRSDDIEKIAITKVREAYNIVKEPCIAQDSGFFIDTLNGFPKAFVNFSLETLGIGGILKLMENEDNRNCSFKECLAYYDGTNPPKCFYGINKGTLSKQILGNDTEKKWSDLWYIFKPKGYDKTLAEMTEEERDNRIKTSENISAMEIFAKWYISQNNE